MKQLRPIRVAFGKLASKAAADPVHGFALLAFILNAFLVSAQFFPNLSEINAWDEAAYVNNGRALAEGWVPPFASNPLVALFYAVTYLPFANSPFWLIQSTSLGRAILYALIWLAVYAVARRLSRLFHPLVVLGFLFVSSIPFGLLSFPSDPLFVVMMALSLSYLLAYLNTGDERGVWIASLFTGLAALARNDGLVMGAVLVLVTLFLSWRNPRRGRAILGAVIPFGVLVGGYLLLYGLFTGRFELGTLQRAYDNFEAGHQVIYAGEGLVDPVIEAKLEARRVFGSPEENNYSILRAIQRNPAVYLLRLGAVVKMLPGQLLEAYGKRMAVPIFLLAARGLVELIRNRQYRLTLLLVSWGGTLLSGFAITLFRIGHLRFPFYIALVLAGYGLVAALKNLSSRRELVPWMAGLSILGGYGVLDSKLAITYGGVLLLGGLLISRLLMELNGSGRSALAVPLVTFLVAGVLLHGDYPGPKQRTLGDEPQEQGLRYLVENFEPGTRIAAGSLGIPYAARMTYMGLSSPDVPRTKSAEEFLDWIQSQGIEAIYVDQSLSHVNPYYWEQISALIGNGLERTFSAGEGDIQVLVVTQ